MNADMPTMIASASAHSTYSGASIFANNAAAGALNNAALGQNLAAQNFGNLLQMQQAKVVAMSNRRIVQVFIADPNVNIALLDCLLYKGDEKLTDATDQELFFELDIKEMLEAHNIKRVKIIDKKVKDRTEYLEPAKIRDLKMVVVTVANL